MELKVQQYLRSGKTPDDLKAEYGINHAEHKTYPNLILFKYSQLDSPLSEEIVQECRGLILDQNNNWDIVSFPYKKFFNVEEGHAAVLDMTSARFLEKLDGSIMTLYHYDNQWHVSSSGLPDASGEINTLLPGKTFADIFWDAWKQLGYVLPDSTQHNFMLEMMTPYNRIICRHAGSDIVLHGVRNRETLQEESPEPWAAKMGWKCVQSVNAGTLEQAIEAAKKLDPMQHEGYVVVDKHFNRVKIKSPQYVAFSHMKEGLASSARSLLEIVRNNESSEFLSYFPEFTDAYNKTKAVYLKAIDDIQAHYEQIKHIETQKDFAFEACKSKFSKTLFDLRANKVASVEESLRDANIKKLFELLGGDNIIKS
jgi:hypothetical protein